MLGYDQEIDKRLNDVEAILLRLTPEFRIFGGNITRWRWDEPNITFTWTESPIGKSLQVTCLEESGNFEVGISAWKDIDEPGDRRRRQWNSQITGTSLQLAELYAALDSALRTLAGWKEDSLVKTAHLI